MTTQASLHEQIAEFVRNVVTAMGVTVTVTSEVNADGIRVDVSGEEGELLVRRKGEANARRRLRRAKGVYLRATHRFSHRTYLPSSPCDGRKESA